MPAIIHLITPYLFHTGSWIYSQITGILGYQNFVFTQKKENLDQFPFEKVYWPGDFSGGKQLINRVYRRFSDRYGLFFRRATDSIRPSLFHAHMGYEAARWLRFVRQTGLPLVTTFYGLDVSQLGRIPKWQRRYLNLFDYGAVFLAEGSFLKKQLIGLGCPPEKIKVQHLGVPLERYPVKSYGGINDKKKFIILQVATFREKKGIEYALQAIAALRSEHENIEFRLIGKGDTNEAELRIRKRIEALNIGDCVTLPGAKSHIETLQEMAHADILLQPSVTAADGDNEGGAPVSVIEASGIGLPVVSSFHADIPEVVKNGTTGLLAPERNVEELTKHLHNLLSHPGMMSQMGTAGRVHVEQEYNLSRQIAKLEQLYSSILAMKQ